MEDNDMKIENYDDIMNPVNPALDLAAMIGGSATRWSRNTWRKRLRQIGEQRFRLELYYYWSELRQGEAPRNRAAALTARLDGLLCERGL